MASVVSGNQVNGNGSTNRVNLFNSKVTVVLGAQWGDEGKGKVVDMLATDVDIVCRCQVSSFNLLECNYYLLKIYICLLT